MESITEMISNPFLFLLIAILIFFVIVFVIHGIDILQIYQELELRDKESEDHYQLQWDINLNQEERIKVLQTKLDIIYQILEKQSKINDAVVGVLVP